MTTVVVNAQNDRERFRLSFVIWGPPICDGWLFQDRTPRALLQLSGVEIQLPYVTVMEKMSIIR